MGKLAVVCALAKTGTRVIKQDLFAARIWGGQWSSVRLTKLPVLSRNVMTSLSNDDVVCLLSVLYEI